VASSTAVGMTAAAAAAADCRMCTALCGRVAAVMERARVLTCADCGRFDEAPPPVPPLPPPPLPLPLLPPMPLPLLPLGLRRSGDTPDSVTVRGGAPTLPPTPELGCWLGDTSRGLRTPLLRCDDAVGGRCSEPREEYE
jgi:hypothetical protein